MADETKFDVGRSTGPHLHFCVVKNKSGKPETVLSPVQFEALARLAQDGGKR